MFKSPDVYKFIRLKRIKTSSYLTCELVSPMPAEQIAYFITAVYPDWMVIGVSNSSYDEEEGNESNEQEV